MALRDLVDRRWIRPLLAAAAAVSAVVPGLACGPDDDRPGSGAARFLDPRAQQVVAISLDYDGEDWEGIKRLYARAARSGALRELLGTQVPVPPTLDGALNVLAGFSGLSFREDIEPVLGGTLFIGTRVTPAAPLPPEARDILERLDPDATRFGGPGPRYFDRDGHRLDPREVESALRAQSANNPSIEVVATYEAPNAEALERLVDRLKDQGLEPRPLDGIKDAQHLTDGVALVGGNTVVTVFDSGDREPDAVLREVLSGGDGSDPPPLPEAEEALVAYRAAPAALGLALDASELDRALRQSAAGRALREATARLDVSDDEITATATVDFEGLPDDELPLGPPEDLALPTGEAIASASSNQQRTTVFLARLARELFPDSRFLERVLEFERDEGVRFEDEVLRAFEGPAATIMRLDRRGDTQFAARSSLRDADRMRELLPRLAPALPGILEGLQGLRTVGLSALLFVAPDAPLTPAAATFLAQVQVKPLQGSPDELELYEVRGLDPRNREPLPDALVYALAGDVFLVGSNRELAAHAATMPLEAAEPAGARMHIDINRLADQSSEALGEEASGLLRALVTTVDLEASARDGDVTASARIALRR